MQCTVSMASTVSMVGLSSVGISTCSSAAEMEEAGMDISTPFCNFCSLELRSAFPNPGSVSKHAILQARSRNPVADTHPTPTSSECSTRGPRVCVRHLLRALAPCCAIRCALNRHTRHYSLPCHACACPNISAHCSRHVSSHEAVLAVEMPLPSSRNPTSSAE